MTAFTGAMVDALYLSELDRLPDAAERDHWLAVIDEHGIDSFAERIVTSQEAAARRLTRAQHATRHSIDSRKARLERADLYFADLMMEIEGAPTVITITEGAAAGVPPPLLDRLDSSKTIRLAEHSASSGANIRLCAAAELEESPAPEAAIVALLGPPVPARNLGHSTYRVQAAEIVRHRLARMSAPLNMGPGELLNLQMPSRRGGTIAYPAILLERKAEAPHDVAERATWTVANANLRHFVSGQLDRCLEVLDGWDLMMGTSLARRYKAFADVAA